MELTKILVLSILLVFLIGCKAQQSQTSGSQQDASEKPSATKETSKPESTPPAKQDKGASSEFINLLSGKANLEWMIDYDVSSKVQDKTVQTKMTQYFKGEKKIRTDVAAQGIKSRSYLVNDVLTICTKNQGSWNCFKSDVKKDNVADTEKDIKQNSGKYNIVADGTKTVAGTSTKCYKVVGDTKGINMRYCFTSDGIPLYMLMESSDFMTEIIATRYSKSVSDSDFEMPAGAQTQSMPSPGGSSDPCSACSYLTGQQKDSCLATCGG